MKKRTLTLFSILALVVHFVDFSIADEKTENIRGIKKVKRIQKLDDEVKKNAKSINESFLVFSEKLNQEKLPLLIYLHGAGGRGDDIERIKTSVIPLLKGLEKFVDEKCIVVAPQCLRDAREGGRGSWKYEELNEWLKQLKSTLPIDDKRIYLMGNSMGGYGSWMWGGNTPNHFAAIAPIVGGIGPNGPKDVTKDLDKWAKNLSKVPVYAYAGAKDRVVPAERSERMISAIRKAGGQLSKIKVFPNEGHGAKRLVLSSSEFYKWMFSQKQK